MRIARPKWLLSLLTLSAACASYQKPNSADHRVFEYHDAYGKIATFDLVKMTITSPGKIIRLSDCSNSEFVCFESTEAKIVVPRHCEAQGAFSAYLSGPSDLEFIGNEGLSGNIFKAFVLTDKFAYAYHFENGLVQLVIIPESVDKRITIDRSSIVDYTYRISRLKGPFACAAKRAGG